MSYLEDMRALSAVNVHPPLPPSPCVKSRTTGVVCVWCETFARRPEEFRNCDENGDTDPARWQGRFPSGYPAYDQMAYVTENPRTLHPSVEPAPPPEPMPYTPPFAQAPAPAPAPAPAGYAGYGAVQPIQGLILGVPVFDGRD
jgi:hypothetical protein